MRASMRITVRLITVVLFAAAIIFYAAGISCALDAETELPDNGLPVVIIEIDETEGHTIEDMNASKDHSVECYGTMQINVPEGFQYCDLDTVPESLGPVDLEYIRGRGNSTWNAEKKPYKLKLKKKTDIFGLGKNKHWVLLANAFDTTAFKNRLTGWLGDEIGLDFTPRGVSVDVVMIARRDGTEISREYLGNYLFAEHLRIDDNRIEIPELTAENTEPEDITGGYLIQNGSQVSNSSPDRFYTDRGYCLANDTPTFDPADPDYTNEVQKEYIRARIQDMENAIYGEGVEDETGDIFTNTKGIRYNEYMDMESAAKYWLIQELSANGDAYKSGSAYFYKKPDIFDGSGQQTAMGKFYWGPLWDFDIAWETDDPDNNVKEFNIYGEWIMAMLYDGDENGFRETVKRVWPQIRDKALEAVEEGGLADQYYMELKDSYAEDYEIWKYVMGYPYMPRPDFQAAVSILKRWTINRISWMDSHIMGYAEDTFPNLDEIVCKISYVVDGRIARRDYWRNGSYMPLYSPGNEDSGYEPEKEGCVFTGWLLEDGSSAGQGVLVTKDITLTAQFVNDDQATHAEDLQFRKDEEWCNIDLTRYFDSKYSVIPSDAQEKKITWSSSDESIASVDKNGRVMLYGTGTVIITGTLKNGIKSSYELAITSGAQPVLENMEITPEEITLKVGEHKHIDAAIVPKLSLIDEIWFSSEDINIASVDMSGVVTGLTAGSTKVKVEAEHYDENTGKEIKVKKYCNVTVISGAEPDPPLQPDQDTQQISIQGADVIFSSSVFTYNGKIQKPVIKSIGGRSLEEGVDYTSEWSDASSVNAGTYTVNITGKGNYTGTAEAAYTINRADNPIAVKGKTARVKYRKLRKKTQFLAYNKVMRFTVKPKGTVVYQLYSVKKGNRSFRKKFIINKTTGQVTAKKGLKKGTYKVTVGIKAAGDSNYKESAVEKVTFKVRIK